MFLHQRLVQKRPDEVGLPLIKETLRISKSPTSTKNVDNFTLGLLRAFKLCSPCECALVFNQLLKEQNPKEKLKSVAHPCYLNNNDIEIPSE